jgi:hypothetical protein
MYNKKTNKRLRKKTFKTKRFRTKSNKMRRNTIKRYRKNKKGGIYGVRPPPSGAIHHGTEIPHYHFNVFLPGGRVLSLETSFGITHFLEAKQQQFYSDYVANVLQAVQHKTRDSNLTLFWKGKMLLPSMKLRRINVDGQFIDLSEISGDMKLTAKYTNQLTREDFENIADEYSPEESSTEYRDKPDTPREVKGESVSSYDENVINMFTQKIEERKRQLGI